jgi:2-C-methyl-D-erythritol 4-phosphate cytidylyltransferase/2-C-methyl-D-erythritol 2,4-cyclodiphosphate synthase
MTECGQARIVALVVAAGRGSRAGGPVPKQYALVGGAPVLTHTVTGLLASETIARVRVVIHPDDAPLYALAVSAVSDPRLGPPVVGGVTRQASVLAGLEALFADPPDIVLVHDAARPFVSREVIEGVVRALDSAAGALPAVPVADTLKRASGDGAILATVPRDGLFAAQTPQGFRFAALLAAHRAARDAGREDFTDDAALLEWRGEAVLRTPGDPGNVKITTANDLVAAARRLAPRAVETRTGIGYDVHAFADGDHVMLGGVRVPHGRGVAAHSDGDVILHALTDALLGALGDGDIGVHFPPSDPQWRGAPSSRFLAFAAERVRARGGRIAHLDAALVAEAPRLGPHRAAMRAAIAAAAGVEESRVSLKATTSEKLGFTGRAEGLAAFAVATIELPGEMP